MKKELVNAFVTRQYMLSKDFEIFYYNDKKYTHTPVHNHDYYEFYFFIRGNVSMVINEKVTKLTPGDLVLIPPGVPHYPLVHSVDDYYERFVFWISTEYLNEIMSTSPECGYMAQLAEVGKKYMYHFDTYTTGALHGKIFALLEEIHSNRFGKSTHISLLVSELVFSLNRAAYEFNHSDVEKEEHTLYQNILLYIDENLDGDLSLDALAEHFYVSKYYISHTFKDNMGLSIHNHILKKRLDTARSAIKLGANPTTVFETCGFTDYSTFYRAFKKEFGVSPNSVKSIGIQTTV